MDLTFALCGIGIVVLFALVLLLGAIRIVQEYERLVVFRLGRCVGERGPGHRLPDPVHRPRRAGRSARAGARDPAPDVDHQGQRPDLHRLPLVLQGRRPGRQRAAGRQLRGGRAGHGHHHPALGHRRHPARRRPVAARAHQPDAAHQAGRGDRALGRQGDQRRDPRDHPAARGAGGDEPPDDGRARAAGGRHRIRPARARRRSTSPKARSRRPSCRPRATSRPTSCRPRARSRPSCCGPKAIATALEKIFAVAKTIDQKTMTLQYFETLKSHRAPAPRPSTSSRWSSPACWGTSSSPRSSAVP